RASEFQLTLALPQRTQPQRVEADKARRVALVVSDRTLLERHQVLIVERIFALAPDDADIALVELEPHAAGDEFLAAVDRGLQHVALGREPEAIVNQLGVLRHELVLEM